MKPKQTIPGFADRRVHQKTYRIMLFVIIMKSLLPLGLLLFIDLTHELRFLVPILVLFPFPSELRFQAQIWYHHIKRFGVPGPRAFWTMWRLDAQRRYAPLGSGASQAGRGHVFEFVATIGTLVVVLMIGWSVTGFATLLYIAMHLTALLVKALIRRGRPPAVLFLAASSLDSSSLQLGIQGIVAPLVVVSLLYHRKTEAFLHGMVLDFFSYRTTDDVRWQDMVADLMKLSQYVIIDIRTATDPVRYEIDLALRTMDRNRLFFVGSAQDDPPIPAELCYSEAGLIERFRVQFHNRSERKPARARTYRDRRNGYFTIVPPAGWRTFEYDDVRSKVMFSLPSDSNIFLRIIASEAKAAAVSPERIISFEDQQRLRDLGLPYEITESTFLGYRSCEVTTSTADPPITSRLIVFIAEGIQFNMQYGAPSQAAFDQHWAEVMQSMATLTPLKQVGGPSTTAREHDIARLVRMARITADSVGVEQAKHDLRNAARKYPNSQLIRDTLAELEQLEDTY